MKVLTIPKLELSACLLPAKLLHLVATDLNIPTAHQYAWTDGRPSHHRDDSRRLVTVVPWLAKSAGLDHASTDHMVPVQ